MAMSILQPIVSSMNHHIYSKIIAFSLVMYKSIILINKIHTIFQFYNLNICKLLFRIFSNLNFKNLGAGIAHNNHELT